PATRIDAYAKGGFYGFLPSHHRSTEPKMYDSPVCWLPHTADNSAGGQLWIPKGSFGPLGGMPVHLSYGRCKGMLLLMNRTTDGVWQGGCVDIPGWQFESGVKTGKFHPRDGSLYVVGLSGWQTSAKKDGCLHRIRYVGGQLSIPTKLSVHPNEVRLT